MRVKVERGQRRCRGFSVSQNWEPYIQNIAIERDSSSGFEEVGVSEILYASYSTRKGINSLANSLSPLKWTHTLLSSPLKWTWCVRRGIDSPTDERVSVISDF